MAFPYRVLNHSRVLLTLVFAMALLGSCTPVCYAQGDIGDGSGAGNPSPGTGNIVTYEVEDQFSPLYAGFHDTLGVAAVYSETGERFSLKVYFDGTTLAGIYVTGEIYGPWVLNARRTKKKMSKGFHYAVVSLARAEGWNAPFEEIESALYVFEIRPDGTVDGPHRIL